MPLPDKSRIATCSATRFCLSREHPLDPPFACRHAERKFGQISSRMTEYSAPWSAQFLRIFDMKESLYGR